VGETATQVKEQGAGTVLSNAVDAIKHDAMNHPEKLLGELTVALAAGKAIKEVAKPGGPTAKEVTVTSWADKAVTPD
jgi:hypothetical protein